MALTLFVNLVILKNMLAVVLFDMPHLELERSFADLHVGLWMHDCVLRPQAAQRVFACLLRLPRFDWLYVPNLVEDNCGQVIAIAHLQQIFINQLCCVVQVQLEDVDDGLGVRQVVQCNVLQLVFRLKHFKLNPFLHVLVIFVPFSHCWDLVSQYPFE